MEGVGEVTGVRCLRMPCASGWIPRLLVKYGLEVSDVMGAISTQNVQVASGDIAGQPTNGKRMITATIRASSLLNTPEQFEQIALKTLSDGSVVRIKDIGEVSLGQETYYLPRSLRRSAFFRCGHQLEFRCQRSGYGSSRSGKARRTASLLPGRRGSGDSV